MDKESEFGILTSLMISALEAEIISLNGTTNTTAAGLLEDPEIYDLPAYLRTTAIIVCTFILIFGVIGNVLVPIVIIRTKDMRNSTNIFLMNLSVADLLVLVVCTPTVLVEVNSLPETWVLGENLCKIIPFVELTVAHASVLTILAITFERYYAICEPLRAGYVCTKARAIAICVITWLVAAFCTSPIIMISEHRQMEYVDGSTVAVCLTQANTFWSMSFFLVINVIFYLGPFVLLIFMYTVIARHLMADPGTNCSESAYYFRARRQVVVMLITVVVTFFICLLPFRLLTLWIIMSSADSLASLQPETYYIILYFCRIMLYLNSAINPILYNLMSSKFRQGFKKLFPPFKRQTQFRLRYTNTLSTTLSHSSTRATILGTGSSLVRRATLQDRHQNGSTRKFTHVDGTDNAEGNDGTEEDANGRCVFQLDQLESFV